MKFIKLKYAWRLLRARHFVLLTDKAAVIDLEGANPESFSDIQLLLTQQTELSLFKDSLNKLIGSHRDAVDNLRSGKMRGKHGTKNTSNRKPRKHTTIRKATSVTQKATKR